MKNAVQDIVCLLDQTSPPCLTSSLVTTGFLSQILEAVPIGETPLSNHLRIAQVAPKLLVLAKQFAGSSFPTPLSTMKHL